MKATPSSAKSRNAYRLLWLALVLLVVATAAVITYITGFGAVHLPLSTIDLTPFASEQRVMPSTDEWANEVHAPIAWTRAMGQGVSVVELVPEGLSIRSDTQFASIAPEATLTRFPLPSDTSDLFTAIHTPSARIVVVPFPMEFERARLDDAFRTLMDEGIAVIIWADWAQTEVDVAWMNAWEAAGAITVGGYDWTGIIQDPLARRRNISLYALGRPRNPAHSVAAVAALYLQVHPQATGLEIKEGLIDSAKRFWLAQDPDPARNLRFQALDGQGIPHPRRMLFEEPFVYARVNAARAVGFELTDPWYVSAMNLPAAHTRVKGSGVTIAIVDFGFSLDHPQLQDHLTEPASFGSTTFRGFNHTHGTDMSLIAATVAPEAKIMPLLVVMEGDSDQWGQRVASAIAHAANSGVDVISMSLGEVGGAEIEAAIDEAIAKGTSVVWINYQGSNDAVIRPDVIGAEVEADLHVLPETDDHLALERVTKGRSGAAPQVAGLVALVKEAHPDWSPLQIKEHLQRTATVLDGGSLFPDAFSAVQ